MGFFRRKRPDGETTWGYGVFLVGGALVIGGALYASHGTLWGNGSRSGIAAAENQPTDKELRKNIKLQSVRDAAGSIGANKSITPANEREKVTGDRLAPEIVAGAPKPTTQTSSNTSATSAFETISTNFDPEEEQRKKDERPSIDESGGGKSSGNSGFAPLPSSPRRNGDKNGENKKQISIKSLVRDEDVPAVDQGKTKDTAGGTATPAIPTHPGASTAGKIMLPRGEIVDVFLMNTVQTGNMDSYLELAVAKPVYWHGKLILPFGARIIAAASTESVRDRLRITASAVRFLDGKELPFSGIARDLDKATGVRGYYLPPPKWVQLAPYVNDFLTAYIDTVSQRNTTLSVGGVNVSVGKQAQADAYLATSTAIRDFASRQLNELSERYAAHLMVPAGLQFQVQLTAPFDATPLYVETATAVETKPVLPPRPETINSPSRSNLSANSPRSNGGQPTDMEQAMEIAQAVAKASTPKQETTSAKKAPGEASDFFPTDK